MVFVSFIISKMKLMPRIKNGRLQSVFLTNSCLIGYLSFKNILIILFILNILAKVI